MPIDFEDGGFISESGDMGVDSHGHVHMRMGDNMSLDTSTGHVHITTDWDDDGCGRRRGRRGGGLLSFLFRGDDE